MQFSKLVIAAFLALASSVTAAPIAAGGDLIEARTGTDQTAIQAIGNIAQFQHDTNKGFVAVQLDPQTAASLLNAGFITQVSHKRSTDQDAVQAIGNIVQSQHDTNHGGLVAIQVDPQTAISLGNLGIIHQFSGRDQTALQAIGNIAQFQHDTNQGAIAIQADPQTAVSAGNVGVISQFKGFWPRATTQTAGQSVGNIVQSQSNSNSGGLVAIQVDPQVALSLGNLGLIGQSASGGGSTTQNAGQAVGNIVQTQHNTNKGGLVGIQADPQIGISAGNAGAIGQSVKW